MKNNLSQLLKCQC